VSQEECARLRDGVPYVKVYRYNPKHLRSDKSLTKWQSEWNNTTKGVITKSFFPKIADRLKLKINVTPDFTTMARGHGTIKAYLYRFKIKDSPMRSCKRGEQTIDHIVFNCDRNEPYLKLQCYGQKTGP